MAKDTKAAVEPRAGPGGEIMSPVEGTARKRVWINAPHALTGFKHQLSPKDNPHMVAVELFNELTSAGKVTQSEDVPGM